MAWLTNLSSRTRKITLIGTYDNLVGINSNFVNYSASQEIQTATAGQTVFTLTTMAYQPGTNSLSVFVDGVNQYGPGASYAFTETSSTSVTFASGLHVGASVKFTTSVINSASYGNAFQISYTPPFTNSVTTNVGDKLGEYVNVFDFMSAAQISDVKNNNGTLDVQPEIQNCLDYCYANSKCAYFPAGTYLVQDSLCFMTIKLFAAKVGASQRLRQICRTNLSFAPSTVKTQLTVSERLDGTLVDSKLMHNTRPVQLA